jgi:plasmid stabilization system protein ParE
MSYRFTPLAARQFEYAFSHYNLRSPGTGEAFLDEFVQAMDIIVLFPDAWPAHTADTRRCRLRRFPYSIIYQLEEDMIVVLALPHLHSDPDQWLIGS